MHFFHLFGGIGDFFAERGLLKAVAGPCELVEAVVEVVGLVGAGAAPGFVFFGEICMFLLAMYFATRFVELVDVPASMSISVIGFPLGSYIGLASTSNFEDLIAGYKEPDRGGVAFAEGSSLTAGDRAVLYTESVVKVPTGVDLTTETR